MQPLSTDRGSNAPEPDAVPGRADPYQHLVHVVSRLSLARDLPAIMAVVRRAARELTGADGATFVLRDGACCYYADEDAIGPLWKGQRFPMATCISGWAMTHREPAVVENIFTDPRIPLSAYEPTFVRSVVMVPIRAPDPVGAIGTYWRMQRRPDRAEVTLLQALADTTSVAMENVQVYRELETRVRERTAQLEAFVSAVSHDVRAPVRHMQMFAQLLLDRYGDEIDPECREGIALLGEQSGQIGTMAEALLELSRVSDQPLCREPVDLAAIGRELAEQFRVTVRRDVEFVAPPALAATADPALVRVALQNLLGNAWKFSGKVSKPRIELGAVRSGDRVEPVYFVRDNGAGFDSRSAYRLFRPFRRFHRESEFAGTGVGLATVQRVVMHHGGTIWAESAPGEGATFYFTLDSAPIETTLADQVRSASSGVKTSTASEKLR